MASNELYKTGKMLLWSVIFKKFINFRIIDTFTKRVFIYGGSGPTKILDTIESYEIEKDIW